MSLWVTDSSPLIFLAKLNRLDLLRQEAEEVLAPPAVLEEIAEQDDEAKRQIEEAQRTWLEVRPVRDVRLLAVLKRELGDGEAERLRSPWRPVRRGSFSTTWMLAGWLIASD